MIPHTANAGFAELFVHAAANLLCGMVREPVVGLNGLKAVSTPLALGEHTEKEEAMTDCKLLIHDA